MPDIWNHEKIWLFLIFFIPGFLSILVYDLFISSEKRDFSKEIFFAIGYSTLNFAILIGPIFYLTSKFNPTGHPLLYGILLLVVFFLAPVVWPLLLLKIRKHPILAQHVLHPIKRPWDFVFAKRKSYFVILHLKDGTRIGGKYGLSSFASSFPAPEQIYLEELCNLDDDGKFLSFIEGSKGLLISGNEIKGIEFFSGE